MQSLGQWHPELSIVTESASEPVTLAEAKAHCAVEGTAHDTKFAIFIAAARAQVEHLTQRSILHRAYTLRHVSWWEVDAQGLYTGELVLPKGPAIAISAVRYRQASDGELTVLASDQYRLATTARGHSMFRAAFNVSFPALHASRNYDNVEIDYTAGAASGTPTVVDQRLRMAIMMIVGHYHERRESTTWDIPTALASSVRSLTHQLDLSPH